MRIARLLIVFFMNLPIPLAAETLCAVIPQTLSLGEIESKKANVDFEVGVQVSCRNTSARGIQTKVLIDIAQTKPLMIEEEYNGVLRTKIGFRSATHDLSSSLCVNLNLGPDESTMIDIPIIFILRMDFPHHGSYFVSVPISTNIINNGNEGVCR